MSLAKQTQKSRERHADLHAAPLRAGMARQGGSVPAPAAPESTSGVGQAISFDLPESFEVAALVLNWRQTSDDFATLHGRYGEAGPALRHFGLLQWEAGHLDRAADAFTAGLALSPSDGLLWRDLSFVFQALGQTVQALACIRRSLDVAPAEARSWLMLASLLSGLGDQGLAETAFRAAIDRDPTLSDAHFGIALLHQTQRRFDEAITALRATIALEPAHMLARVCLGQALYALGDFAASATEFENAAYLQPLSANAARQLARARTFDAMLSGRVAEALAAYPALAGDVAEDLSVILYTAFSLFSAHGHHAAAIEIGRLRLAAEPEDPIQRYLLDALTGIPHAQAPLDYLERYFDQFAPEFDAKLVELLAYRVPQQLAAIVARHRDRFVAMLDLGCGTGLAVQHLVKFGGPVTGVDLSGKMLHEAAKRGLYGELVKTEALTHLRERPSCYDLVFAADMLTYSGDLAPLLAAVAQALPPGGIFAANIETTEAEVVVLLPSGRFAHAPSSVLGLAAPDFTLLDDVEQVLRMEGHEPVMGRLMVFQRR